MENVPEGLKYKVKRYSLMVAWWHIHEGDKEMEAKLYQILKKIELAEDELRMSGVKTETFERILQKVKRFVKKTVGEMSNKELETLTKLIFGQKTKLEPITQWELNNAILVLDPVRFAERMKKKKKE